MPTFNTPEPISVTIGFAVGDARIVASDRADTVVEVRPSDPSHEPDVRAAEQTRVEYAAGQLMVKAAKQRGLGVFGRTGSIDVTIELPTGSHVHGDASVGAFRTVGRLGECRLKMSSGDIHVDHTGALDVTAGAGAIVVESVAGHAEVSNGSGNVRVREVHGAAVIKNSNGDVRVGEVTGDLRVSTANGEISVDRAHGDVMATSANGHVRVGDVARGSASLKTAKGDVEIGIHAGVAALLDVHTSFGRVRNHLNGADGPEPTDETVQVRAQSSYGDIVIRRS